MKARLEGGNIRLDVRLGPIGAKTKVLIQKQAAF